MKKIFTKRARRESAENAEKAMKMVIRLTCGFKTLTNNPMKGHVISGWTLKNSALPEEVPRLTPAARSVRKPPPIRS
jgi:hypothetical protein